MNIGVLKNTSVAVGLSGIVSAGALFAFLDTRYALGSDVQILIKTINDERTERFEVQIEEVERRIKYMKSVPEPERTTLQEMELEEMERSRERSIRKLEAMSND